jgi:glycerol-3-phosphate responsive antiterminator
MVLKAYNLDQPLRGCMPQPRSQKMEMLYILNRVVSLDSEPKAIADAPGVVPEHKKHLFRIYRLVTIALGVSRQNEEMQNALIRIIEALAIDFNI